MAKLPAFQFYPADWRKDLGVQSLTFYERGVWFEILCLMHDSEDRGKLVLNGKPMSDEMIARLLGLDKQGFLKTVTTLLEAGVASRDGTGALTNRRMVRDERIRQIRKEAGKKGGNPNLVNQNANQNPTPSSSSSFTPSGDVFLNAGDWDYPIRQLIEAFPFINLTPAAIGFIQAEVGPGDEQAWAHTIKTYLLNYDPAKNRYLPEKTGNLLNVFRAEKTRLENANAVNQRHRPVKQTNEDRIAETYDIINQYPSETELGGVS